jgi:uncharacterized protein YbaR (Trm112 family)
MQERDFFNEKNETRAETLVCPTCRQQAEYQVRWLRRTRKPSLPRHAGPDDHARFKNARDYMVRQDDVVQCSKCRRRIEITSKSVVLL